MKRRIRVACPRASAPTEHGLDLAAMCDEDDQDDQRGAVDPVDDPEVAVTDAPQIGEALELPRPGRTRLVGESLLRVQLPKGIAGNVMDCEVMVDQARALDNRRIRKELGKIPKPVLLEVREKLRRLLDL